MNINPFAIAFEQEKSAVAEAIAAEAQRRALTIPLSEDPDLLNQLRSADPRMSDIKDEIAQVKFIREQLRASLEARSSERFALGVQNLLRSVTEKLKKSTKLSGHSLAMISGYIEEGLREYFPPEDMTVENAKVLTKISMDLSALAKRYQEILKGLKIEVEFSSEHYDRLLQVIFRHVSSEQMDRIAAELEKFAPSEAQEKTLKIE